MRLISIVLVVIPNLCDVKGIVVRGLLHWSIGWRIPIRRERRVAASFVPISLVVWRLVGRRHCCLVMSLLLNVSSIGNVKPVVSRLTQRFAAPSYTLVVVIGVGIVVRLSRGIACRMPGLQMGG